MAKSNPGSSSLKLATHARANCKTGTEMYKMMDNFAKFMESRNIESLSSVPSPEESMDDLQSTCINCFCRFIVSISILLQTTDWKEAMSYLL